MSFESLIAKAMRIGVDEVAYPIDVFSTATEIAEHPQAARNFDKVLALIEDKEYYFTRWAAIRAVSQMGPEFITRAIGALERQSKVEDYELALSEIEGTLGKRG